MESKDAHFSRQDLVKVLINYKKQNNQEGGETEQDQDEMLYFIEVKLKIKIKILIILINFVNKMNYYFFF
jgi:anaerobic ribonucleoside-triphosphate reductase